MNPPTAPANSFLQRLIGAMALDTAIYEEVEADGSATIQACAVVLLSSLAAGLGGTGLRGPNLGEMVFVSIVALVSWAAWALLTYQIGVHLLPEPQTKANVGQLLRTIGFASTPGLLRVFGIIPSVTIPAFAIAAVWMLLATIVAVRQALDYQSTARAVAVCVIGWALTLAFAVVLGLIFAPSVS
jgi:hypothetical protein